MAYKPKPELEEGNYIAYTNEPDTVVDAGSGGGGGGEGAGGNTGKCSFTIVVDSKTVDPTVFDNLIKLNGELLSGFENRTSPDHEFESPVPMLDVTADAFSLLEVPISFVDLTVGTDGAGFINAIAVTTSATYEKLYTPTPAFNGTYLTIIPD